MIILIPDSDNDHDDDKDGDGDVGGTWGRSMNRPTASSTCFSSARLISMINDHNRHEDYAGDQQMILDSQAFFCEDVKQGHVLGTWCAQNNILHNL